MATFNLPELGEGLEEGEIVSWKVKVGDSIKADETMVEVMTDKATVEVPSPASGTVKKLYYKEGDSAQVGQSLIEIEESGVSAKTEAQSEKNDEAIASEQVEAGIEEKREASTGQRVASAAPAFDTSTDKKILASPAVRKMARHMGVDLSVVKGSGERGRVLRTDLESAGSSPSQLSSMSVQREERKPYIGIRRKIGDQLAQSMYTAVHFTHNDEADFSEIIRLREKANEYSKKFGDGTRLSYLPFFIKAAVHALKKYPILNSTLDQEKNEIVIKNYFNFGISVQTDNGLMVAVVRDCEQKDVFEIAKEMKEVVDKARSGKATRDELTGSTITITNVGSIGGLHATPVINFPETAILGMYEIKKRPIVVEEAGEDRLVIRPMMYLNVTCDHRIIDGAIAAHFLKELIANIEEPSRMAFY